MPFPTRELSNSEMEEFLKENNTGILCFGGDEPYGIPMGFLYKKGTVILGFSRGGRKLACFQKSPKVCLTVCRPRKNSPDLKESCTTVILEGELGKVTDMSQYDLEKEFPKLPESIILFALKVNKLGTKKCLQQPCEVLAGRERSKQ